jgi:hypothetical protein
MSVIPPIAPPKYTTLHVGEVPYLSHGPGMELIPPKAVRLRRDVGQLMRAIKSHARRLPDDESRSWPCPFPLSHPWESALRRVASDDPELIAFLRRVCGYALTGITRDHALFFLYGTGANGKSVFLSAITGILAEYHTTAPIETFTASQSERHPTDLAGLRGAQLVKRPKPRTVAAGLTQKSRCLPAATKSRLGSCARIFSNSSPASS